MAMINTNQSPIPLPNIGHLHISPNGYITWEEHCKWDNEKKQPASGRVSIGKIASREDRTFFPNKKYFEVFPDISDRTACPAFSSVLNYGPYLALQRSAVLSGCYESLRRVFPDNTDRILALAYHAITTETCTASHFPFWFFHNYCGMDTCFYDSHISEMYRDIGSDPEAIRNFQFYFRENYQKMHFSETETVVAFDSTNQNSHSTHNRLAERGKAKINEQLPDVNTAMFTDELTGIPLYYEHFYGSILDKTETPVTLEKVEDLGYKKVFLMMDRGYADTESVKELSEFEYGLMLPDGLRKVKSIIEEEGPKIRDVSQFYIQEERIFGMKLEEKQEILGQKVTAYVFYDSNRAAQERQSILDKVHAMKTTVLTKRKRYSEKLRDTYEKWLVITKEEKHEKGKPNFRVEQNEENIDRCLKKAGYFVIISNTEIEASVMIRIARNRDKAEKTFQDLKQHLGLTKAHTHSGETYEGKMFVAFVALIIRETYKWIMKEWLNSHDSYSVETSLGELSKLQIERKLSGDGWQLKYALTKKQKEILDFFTISQGKVNASISKLKLA